MTIKDLQFFFERYINDEGKYIKYLYDPGYDKSQVLLGLASVNVHLAVCNIEIDSDFLKAHNRFYKAALIKIYLHEKVDCGRRTSYNIFSTHHGFCYAILSDNEFVLNKYILYTDDFWKYFAISFAKAIQACVKNDDLELSNQIELLQKYTSKNTSEKYFGGAVNAFRGILQEDKILLEQGLKELLEKHHKQDQPAVLKDFINIEALTLAKLAYRKGIIVEIDNPLLPKEMIPVQELTKYESYDFLKELEATL